MDEDRYEVLDVVGSGGMATVWRARDRRLGRLVAVKRPNVDVPGGVDVARFAREARAAATVAHPHVVPVYDVGTDDTGPYLVMELVEGPSLASAEVPAERIARVGAQVASALAALHAAGVVHGDVKPGNVLLASDGAKLTDFGIARRVDDTVTLAPGSTFGTPAYAAPETLTRGERSAAADVYSLAALLYEQLAGVRWSPGLASTQPMPPRHWAAVLEPALAPEPTARPTAATLAASLAALDGDGRLLAPTVPIGRDRPPDRPPATTPVQEAPARPGRAAVVIFAGVLVAAIALIVAVTSFDDDGIGADPAPSTPLASAVVTESSAAPPTSSTATIAPTVATTAATTAPSVTTAPPAAQDTTAAVTVAPVNRSAAAVAAELTALIDGIPRDELRPNEANDLTRRIDVILRDAERESGAPDQQVREAAEGIAADLAGDRRDEAEVLLAELAEALGIDPSVVAEQFDRIG